MDNKILMFFEYEKHDTLKEFKKNYIKEIKHFNNSEKKEFNLGLKRLFFDNLIDDSYNNYGNEIIIFLKEQYDINIETMPFNKILKNFENMIKNGEVDDNLKNQANLIVERYMDEDDINIEPLYKIKDLLKKRINTISKEEAKMRKLLRDIISKFEIVLIKYKEDVEQKQDNMFYVLDYFLHKEDSYLYLKKITKLLPSIINTKVVTYSKKPILEYILDMFIENYKKMIFDKNSDYISKDFLKEVYMLFYNDYHLSLTKDEMKKIDTKLLNFVTEMNNYLTSSKRKNAIKNDIKDMYMFKRYMISQNDLVDDYDINKVDNELNNIDINLNLYKEKTTRVNLEDEYAITMANKVHAYSIINRKKKKILKVHIMDISGAIYTNTLTNYLLDTTLKNETDTYLQSKFKFKKAKTYPTITFELEIPGNGIKIYKSSIKIKNNINDKIVDPNIKFYQEIIDQDKIKELDKSLIEIVNERLVKYINDNKIPFIYSGIRKYDAKEIEEVSKDLSPILSKLTHQEFNQIYKIIKENKDEFHYEKEYFEGASLNIFDNLTYVNLLLIKMINDVILSEQNDFKKNVYTKKINTLVDKLNYSNSYVDSKVIKQNKGKITKQKKITL